MLLRNLSALVAATLISFTVAGAASAQSEATQVALGSDYMQFDGKAYGWVMERSSPSQKRAWGPLADNYQHVYAQLWVKPHSPVQAQLPCKGSIGSNGKVRHGRGNFWGNFLGLFGIKQHGFAAILITVKNQRGESLVTDVPIVTFIKNGDTCERRLFEGPISPKILRRAGDRLNVEYKMVHKRLDRSDITAQGTILSTASEVSAAFSQNLTDGLVADLAKFSADRSLAPALQAFFGNFLNESAVMSGNRNLFFGKDEADDVQPTDSLFMVIGEPVFNGSLVTIADAREEVSNGGLVQLSIDTVYYATIFGTCRIFNEQFVDRDDTDGGSLSIDPSNDDALENGCSSFDDPQILLSREFDGTQLKYAHTIVPSPATENQSLTSLSAQLEALKPNLIHRSRTERNRAIATLEMLCSALKSSSYIPNSILNSLDNTLLRFAILDETIGYGDDPRVRTLKCFSRSELDLLRRIAQKNSEYELSGDNTAVSSFVWPRIAADASRIIRSPITRADRYHLDITLEIDEPFLRRELAHSLDLNGDGSPDSPGLPDISEPRETVLQVLTEALHFEDSYYCPVEAVRNGQIDYSRVGFMQNVVEKVDGQPTRERGVGIIAEFDASLNTNTTAKLKALYVTSWDDLLQRMGHRLTQCAEPADETKRQKYSGVTIDWD